MSNPSYMYYTRT